jgi:hypothetical protein
MFFTPIVENLNMLQQKGMRINGVNVRFSFSTIAADNLAANEFGGYQSCFNSGYFCRRCYIQYADRVQPLSNINVKMRTSIDHDNYVQRVLNDPDEAPLFGIVGQSIFHDLTGFHPTTSLPGDIMHDLFEGVCPIVIMALLKQASSLRILTYGENIVFFLFIVLTMISDNFQ